MREYDKEKLNGKNIDIIRYSPSSMMFSGAHKCTTEFCKILCETKRRHMYSTTCDIIIQIFSNVTAPPIQAPPDYLICKINYTTRKHQIIKRTFVGNTVAFSKCNKPLNPSVARVDEL